MSEREKKAKKKKEKRRGVKRKEKTKNVVCSFSLRYSSSRCYDSFL